MKQKEFNEIRNKVIITLNYEVTKERIVKSGREAPKGLQKFSDNNNKDLLRFCRDSVGSKKSNKKFTTTLTVEELYQKALVTDKCPLCGCKLDYRRGEHTRKDNGASLDRIDNTLTVTKDNTWIICSKCNTTKSNRTLDEFLDYCTIVSKFRREDLENNQDSSSI